MVTNGHSSSLSSRGTPQGKNALEAGSRSEAIVKGKLSGTSCYERKCIQMCFLTNPPPPPLTPPHTHTHTHETQTGNLTFFLLSPFYSFCLTVESDSQSFEQHLTVTCATAHSSLCTRQFVCHEWQECAHTIRASHFYRFRIRRNKITILTNHGSSFLAALTTSRRCCNWHFLQLARWLAEGSWASQITRNEIVEAGSKQEKRENITLKALVTTLFRHVSYMVNSLLWVLHHQKR